jgi:hypothetical protein
LCRALLRHLENYRFSGGRLKRGKELQDPDRLARVLAGQYLAGRRSPHIPETEKVDVRLFASNVRQVLCEMRKKISDWQRAAQGRGVKLRDETVRRRLREEYDIDAYPWMRYFSYYIRKLAVNARWKSPAISELDSWSINDLVRVVVRETLYQRSGIYYPESELIRVLKAPGKPYR